MSNQTIELEKIAGNLAGVRPGRAVMVSVTSGDSLILEFGAPGVSDVDEILRRAKDTIETVTGQASPRVVMVRSGWLPWGARGARRGACQKKFELMQQRQTLNNANMLSFKSDVSDAVKDSFKYFGFESFIMGPVEISNPSSIHIGNWVSLGRYGRIVLNTNFSRLKECCRQHYPDIHHDFDPIIYGMRSPILKIGDGTSMGDSLFINCNSSINIGRHVLISSRVYIGDANHNIWNLDLPIALSANNLGRPVVIEDHCWIGVGVAILEGVTIGRHSVIGANSVVVSDIPKNCIAVGVPAKPIRMIDGSPIQVK